MKFTFPHMGNAYISIKVLLDTLGLSYVIPPICNKKSLENGIFNSLEFICLPFKTMLGDYIYGLQNGADLLITGGSCGQCRQGYYRELHEEILKSIGYKFEFVNVKLSEMSFSDFYEKFKPYIKNISRLKLALGMLYAAKIVFDVDRLYALANHIRCREKLSGSVDAVLKKFTDKIYSAKGFRASAKIIDDTRKKLKLIETDKNKEVLKVAVIGEIFITCEPFTNLDIERKLGNLGVEVTNTMSAGLWIKEHFIHKLLPFKSKISSHDAAKEFIHTDDIGGHGIDTVGNAVLYSKYGFDGIIHLYPFTCMPEIIAQSTFSAIQDKYDVPIMTLILDELTGEVGYQTRIEAFADMLQLRKNEKSKNKTVLNRPATEPYS